MLSQEQQEKQIAALLKKPENALCADCSSKSPCWASLDFGVFVCMNCSGAHRSLGQSVTRIKSTKLDTWNRDWLWHMQLNNKMINQYFEANLNPVLHKKPNPSSSLNDIKKFVYDKYVRRSFAQSNQDDPITNLKNNKPPIAEPPKVLQQPKSLGSQQITVPQMNPLKNKKIDSLLDDASDDTNRTPSQGNQKVRQDVNLFQGFQDIKKNGQETAKHTLQQPSSYNKSHYNSFSGKGAAHSSTGGINFDDIFGSNINGQNNAKISFEQFNKIQQPSMIPQTPYQVTTTMGSLYPQPHQNHPYGHIHHHNMPHMHIYTTGTGTNQAHGYHHHIANQPTHVTMNINMNMYGNVTNINLKDAGSNAHGSNSVGSGNINQCIKLDVKDFEVGNKKKEEGDGKGKSWVDDWK